MDEAKKKFNSNPSIVDITRWRDDGSKVNFSCTPSYDKIELINDKIVILSNDLENLQAAILNAPLYVVVVCYVLRGLGNVATHPEFTNAPLYWEWLEAVAISGGIETINHMQDLKSLLNDLVNDICIEQDIPRDEIYKGGKYQMEFIQGVQDLINNYGCESYKSEGKNIVKVFEFERIRIPNELQDKYIK